MFSKEERNQIKNDIEYNRLTEEDIFEISNLVRGMNKNSPSEFDFRSQSPEYYNWIYFQNPVGKAIVYGARHNGKLVGNFAMVPKRIQIGNEVLICGKTMDIFTHPDYQGLGIMTQLLRRIIDDTKKKGIIFWYVTPSDKSYPIFIKKWGYIENFELLYMMKILNIGKVFQKVKKIKFLMNPIGAVIGPIHKVVNLLHVALPSSDVEQIERFGEETDYLWEKYRKGYKLALVRDSVYMNWRYTDNPDNYKILSFKRNGEICGVLVLKTVLRRGLKVGEIVDYISAKEDNKLRIDMIKYSIKSFRDDNCAVCQSWVIEDSDMEGEIKKAGLRIKRNRIKFLLSPEAPYKEFYDRDAWLLTQGDGNDI